MILRKVQRIDEFCEFVECPVKIFLVFFIACEIINALEWNVIAFGLDLRFLYVAELYFLRIVSFFRVKVVCIRKEVVSDFIAEVYLICKQNSLKGASTLLDLIAHILTNGFSQLVLVYSFQSKRCMLRK